MPKLLKIVGQEAMDEFYQSFKTDVSDFFELEDFISYTGNTISAIYNEYYKEIHAQYRQEGKDEIVSFDPTMLSEQVVEVKQNGDIWEAKYVQPIFSFMYDNNVVGLQNVSPENKPLSDKYERTSQSAVWQLNYLPYVCKVFYYGDMQRIVLIPKVDANVDKKIRISYVPSMYPEAIIPDGIIGQAISATVSVMKQLAQGTVSKESLDNNYNKIIQSEINKKTVAG